MSNDSDATPLVFLVFGIAVVMWLFDSAILNRAWQSINTSATYQQVRMDNKPHDCDFWTAPIGKKNCDYDKVVTKVMWSTSTNGEAIRSLDGGATWEPRTPGKCGFGDFVVDCADVTDPPAHRVPANPTVTGVVISWEKEAD